MATSSITGSKGRHDRWVGTKAENRRHRVCEQQNHALGLRTASEPISPRSCRGHRSETGPAEIAKQTSTVKQGRMAENPPEASPGWSTPVASASDDQQTGDFRGQSTAMNETRPWSPPTHNVIQGVRRQGGLRKAFNELNVWMIESTVSLEPVFSVGILDQNPRLDISLICS